MYMKGGMLSPTALLWWQWSHELAKQLFCHVHPCIRLLVSLCVCRSVHNLLSVLVLYFTSLLLLNDFYKLIFITAPARPHATSVAFYLALVYTIMNDFAFHPDSLSRERAQVTLPSVCDRCLSYELCHAIRPDQSVSLTSEVTISVEAI